MKNKKAISFFTILIFFTFNISHAQSYVYSSVKCSLNHKGDTLFFSDSVAYKIEKPPYEINATDGFSFSGNGNKVNIGNLESEIYYVFINGKPVYELAVGTKGKNKLHLLKQE